MEEKKTNVDLVEEVAAEEVAEDVTAEPEAQEAPAEVAQTETKPDGKACCRMKKKAVCAGIAIGVASCTVLAAAGCALWFLYKYCEEHQ